MNRTTGLTIGNFDGVHRGHAELVRAARSAVGADGRVVVMSFDPHPISVLRPASTPPRLTSFQRRRELLSAAGADEIIALKPTKELLGRNALDFIKSIVESESPACIIEGPDFRFGKGRAGSIDTLRAYEQSFNYRTIVIDPVEATLRNQHIVRVSSTMVRWLLSRGRVEDAAELLGRPYDLECPVISGDKRGRTIGVPTANLDHGDLLLPADGIYAGRAVIPNAQPHSSQPFRSYPAAISVGTKPTFGEHPRTCEAHLIGYDGPSNQYGWTIRLEFHHWLRDQLVYHDLDPLIDQLHRDIDQTRKRLSTTAVTDDADASFPRGGNAPQPTANRR